MKSTKWRKRRNKKRDWERERKHGENVWCWTHSIVSWLLLFFVLFVQNFGFVFFDYFGARVLYTNVRCTCQSVCSVRELYTRVHSIHRPVKWRNANRALLFSAITYGCLFSTPLHIVYTRHTSNHFDIVLCTIGKWSETMQKWNSQWNHNSIVSASLNSFKLWNFSGIQSNYKRTCTVCSTHVSGRVCNTHTAHTASPQCVVLCRVLFTVHIVYGEMPRSLSVQSQVVRSRNGFANILRNSKAFIYFPLGAFRLHQSHTRSHNFCFAQSLDATYASTDWLAAMMMVVCCFCVWVCNVYGWVGVYVPEPTAERFLRDEHVNVFVYSVNVSTA